MNDTWAQSEAERVQGNMIRVGVVSEVDVAHEDGPRAKMKVGGLDTDWLPWGVARAGTTRTASAPTVGEQRLLFAPYGDTAQGVIGPAIYQDDHPTPTATADQDGVEFPDGTRVMYDAAANRLQIDVAGTGLVVINCKQATVKASTSVTLDTPSLRCTGDVQVDGKVEAGGDVKAGAISLQQHHHTAQGATAPTTAAQA